MTVNLKVINLFAGPGVGKSITAAGLYNLMKLSGESVELVSEFAKDLTYEKRSHALGNQLYVLAKQDNRVRRLVGHVEWVITDSPLPLGLAYIQGREYENWLPSTIWNAFNRYQNYNVLLSRNETPYETAGRGQSLAEAMRLDNQIDHIFSAAQGVTQEGLELRMSDKTPHEIYRWLADQEDTYHD